MDKYLFYSTQCISDMFNQKNIIYDFIPDAQISDGEDIISVPYTLKNGAGYRIIFIISDGLVAVRVFGLISNVPFAKQLRIMEACNLANTKYKWFCCIFDKTDDSVTVKYDFLKNIPNEIIGDLAIQILGRLAFIMDDIFNIFMKAFYTDEALTV